LETVERDYSPKGVQFYYVYKALAHPEHNGYVSPFTKQERLMHVKEAQRTLGSRIPWLCDTMSNDFKAALGGVPNPELVIDPAGRVVRRRGWSDPEALRKDLETLIGPVEHPTREADLDLPTQPPPETVATGIVPRIELPGPMRAVKLEPDSQGTDVPFYAKLRAEADESLLESGTGQLYLGFHLDPLYRVHWNNETKPLSFKLKTPEGVTVEPQFGNAPRVEESADADPREFLVRVEGDGTSEDVAELDLAVHYFACDNANTFCVPVKQNYRIRLERDGDGGSVIRGRSSRPGLTPGPGDMVSRMMRWDADEDGRISRDELPEPMRERFDRMDINGDGAIDAEEMKALDQRRRGAQRGPRGQRPPGEPEAP
jgi:hypothetical protein